MLKPGNSDKLIVEITNNENNHLNHQNVMMENYLIS